MGCILKQHDNSEKIFLVAGIGESQANQKHIWELEVLY